MNDEKTDTTAAKKTGTEKARASEIKRKTIMFRVVFMAEAAGLTDSAETAELMKLCRSANTRKQSMEKVMDLTAELAVTFGVSLPRFCWPAGSKTERTGFMETVEKIRAALTPAQAEKYEKLETELGGFQEKKIRKGQLLAKYGTDDLYGLRYGRHPIIEELIGRGFPLSYDVWYKVCHNDWSITGPFRRFVLPKHILGVYDSGQDFETYVEKTAAPDEREMLLQLKRLERDLGECVRIEPWQLRLV